MDFLVALGIPLQVPYLGIILTGILVSRGANFMHDLLGSVNAIYQSKKDTAAQQSVTLTPIIESTGTADEIAQKIVNKLTEQINVTAQNANHNI
jgi:hypothetical protein